MVRSKYINSVIPVICKDQAQPVEASSPQGTTVPRHDEATKRDKQDITALNILSRAAKLAQSYLEDVEASVGYLHDRLTRIEAALLQILDHGIPGGYDFPPSSLKVVPKVIPTQECVTVHDLLATNYFVTRAVANKPWKNTYAAWVGSGTLCGASYFYHCRNHSEARDRAVAKADGVEYGDPADILVVGPWNGDPSRARVGTTIAVRWTTSMYEVEDPFKASQEDE